MAFYQCVKVGGGGSADIVEVTLAEYIALGDVVNTDGKLYCITDLNNSDVQGYPPIIYSDEEREVGVWRDGKPLYQKTIIYDCANNSNVQTAYSIPNTHFIVTVCDAYFQNSTGGLSQQLRYTWYKDHFWSYIINNSGHVVSVHRETTDGNWQSGVKFFITVQYTKTTDVAGSGIWNGQGGYAHHYSTSETAIGTWIDGSPLYEKTINIGRMTCDTSWHSLNHNIPNVKDVIDIKGIMFVNAASDHKHYPIPTYRPTVTQGVIIGADITAIQYMNNWQSSDNTVYITMQYTKTTD